MGEKDLVQKTLEWYPDVFADMINTMAFGGRHVIDPDELSDATAGSTYKMAGRSHAQDRDVAKFWRRGLLRIASLGLENQTSLDSEMPIRVMSYDAADYKQQTAENKTAKKKKRPTVPHYPVVTFVLYYGSSRWTAPRSLTEMMDIHPDLQPFVSDYRINVIDIAFLDDDTIERFTSDFGSIARLLSNQRKKIDTYTGISKPLIHTRETLELVTAMTGDPNYERAYREEGMGVNSLAEYLNGFVTRGEARGMALGEARGMALGEARGMVRAGRLYGASDAQIRSDLISRMHCTPDDADRILAECIE